MQVNSNQTVCVIKVSADLFGANGHYFPTMPHTKAIETLLTTGQFQKDVKKHHKNLEKHFKRRFCFLCIPLESDKRLQFLSFGFSERNS